jgi:hypothetical protein
MAVLGSLDGASTEVDKVDSAQPPVPEFDLFAGAERLLLCQLIRTSTSFSSFQGWNYFFPNIWSSWEALMLWYSNRLRNPRIFGF